MDKGEWKPVRLLEVSGNFWMACTLHAAVKLDVFTALGHEQFTSREMAEKLNVDMRGVTTLLNALSAMNLLVKRDERYSNSSASATFLSKNSPDYIGHIILHHHHLVDSWAKLDQAVKRGEPVRKRASFNDEVWRESFLMGMFNMAMIMAPHLVNNINLLNRRHLLDLGGGPGTYAIHFCLNNPQLKATVYDLPTTRPFAQKVIEKFGMSDRVDFMDGNYLKEDIQGSYDVAFLSHILHGEAPEDCQKIIQKAVSAMEKGGMIIIHEFILNDSMDSPLFPALFSLNMLLATESGQAYSEKQLMDMMAQAGVKAIQRLPFVGPNESGIITGTV